MLSKERIAELDELGMVWDPRAEGWARGIVAAKAYRKENGHLLVPQSFVTPNGFRLGTWISGRRHERNKGALAQERVPELDALGMVWNPREEN